MKKSLLSYLGLTSILTGFLLTSFLMMGCEVLQPSTLRNSNLTFQDPRIDPATLNGPVTPIQLSDLGDCSKLLGHYTSVDNRHTSLEISLNANQLTFGYDQDLNDPYQGYTVSFIADGIEHDGVSVNTTGKSYTASCSAAGITLVRNGMFIAPYMTVYAVSDGVLTETGTVQGSAPREMGKYQLAPQLLTE